MLDTREIGYALIAAGQTGDKGCFTGIDFPVTILVEETNHEGFEGIIGK